MSEIGLACSGSNEASRQNKIKVIPNFIVSTETFIFFQIWLIDSLTHWLMTHDSLTHLTHKTSVLRIVASFGGYFACRFYPLKLLKCRARYDFRLSCVLKKRRFWARSIQPKLRNFRKFWLNGSRPLKLLGTIRFQFLIYIQNGGSLLIVDVGLFIVGAWQVAYSLLTYLRPVRMIPFSLITDILWLKWAILY